jgi:hypothetical protein
MRVFCLLCVLYSLTASVAALDREAFTFTKYDLHVRIEPEQQRLAVRGKISLRNDSPDTQRNLALQISSTLDWRSIKVNGKPAEFVTDEYNSDLDHTGAFSEAIVNLREECVPKGVLEIEVGYEGTIPLDASRLTRIGAPEDKAKHSDWDQISKSFTAVRGVGYVTWYPIATEDASFSDGNSVEETIGRWKAKEVNAEMQLSFDSTASVPVLFSTREKDSARKAHAFNLVLAGMSVPTFVIADYQKIAPTESATVCFLPGQNEAAEAYGEVARQLEPLIPVGKLSPNLEILGLPDPDDEPFVTEGMLLTPLKAPMTNQAELSIVYAKARQLLPAPRPWIQEGFAHFAQANFVEQQKGRQAALDYLASHAVGFGEAERNTEKTAQHDETRSLINAPDDIFLQTKAMYVWWMLRDMLDKSLFDALLNYHSADDKDPSYLPGLIQKLSQRDLQWFFDDWVYHDRGLPDFHVESVYPTPLERGGFLVTVTIENLGNAGAEVPVTLQYDGGVIRKQLEIHAKSKTSIRVETPAALQEVTVNDGSVPESDTSNNSYKVEEKH